MSIDAVQRAQWRSLARWCCTHIGDLDAAVHAGAELLGRRRGSRDEGDVTLELLARGFLRRHFACLMASVWRTMPIYLSASCAGELKCELNKAVSCPCDVFTAAVKSGHACREGTGLCDSTISWAHNSTAPSPFRAQNSRIVWH